MKRLCYIMINCRMINTSSVNINNIIFMTHFFAVNGTSIVERITFYYMILFWKGRINYFFLYKKSVGFFYSLFFISLRSNWLKSDFWNRNIAEMGWRHYTFTEKQLEIFFCTGLVLGLIAHALKNIPSMQNQRWYTLIQRVSK